MIRAVYLAAQERVWNHDRRRRIEEMLQRERVRGVVERDWIEAMAIQLAEIQALPEPLEPRR